MQLLTLAGILGVFFGASFWIGMGAVLIGLPMSALKIHAVSRRNRTLGEATMDQRMTEYLQNLFFDKDAAYEIKVFRARDYILDMWHEIRGKVIKRANKIQKELIQVESIADLLKIAYAAFAVAGLTAGFLAGDIGLGVLVSVLQSVESLFSAMDNVSWSVLNLGRVTYEISYLREFLGLVEEPEKKEEKVEKGGEIVFDHVSFRYPGTDREILHDVSFRIRSGEKVALVGVNGEDGVDVSRGQWQRIGKFSVIQQNFVKYQFTVRENIGISQPTQIHNDERLMKSAKAADIEKIVQRAGGLDVRLGREFDGVELSGGEWQKLAIARGLNRDAEVILLDEPTSALDPLVEYDILRKFLDMTEGKTSVIISHRIGLGRFADKIIVMKEGKVAQTGTHDELLAAGGEYSRMWHEQARWYE